jgi:hypothetical protein
VLEAFATTAGNLANTREGKVRKLPPPASAFRIPAANPAAMSRNQLNQPV